MAMVRASKNIVSYVRELKPRKDTSRIEVRIVCLWRNYNKESRNTIEMVFVDKKWIRIHASVGEQLIKKFDDKLRERDAIVVQLFKVLHDDSLALTNNDSSQWSVGTATSILARSFFLNERLSIREIIDSTLVGTFVTLGTIETIDIERIVRNEDEDFLPEAVSDLFGKRVLFEISVDADNIKGKSSQCVVRLATDDREMVEEFADLPPKPVLMLESADDISSGSGGFTATPLSKRKSEQDEDSCLEDQHSVNKKLSQKKLKGE
ncbi:hypothetical protein YC2023_109413 [Brassica napus]